MSKKNNVFLEQKNLLNYILTIILVGVLFAVMIKVPSPLVITFAALAIGAMILITFATYYELREEYIYIRNGFLVNKIYYRKIKEIGKCKKILPKYPKLFKDKIYIKHGENLVTGVSYLSPKDLKKFEKELNKKIEIKGADLHDKKN